MGGLPALDGAVSHRKSGVHPVVAIRGIDPYRKTNDMTNIAMPLRRALKRKSGGMPVAPPRHTQPAPGQGGGATFVATATAPGVVRGVRASDSIPSGRRVAVNP